MTERVPPNESARRRAKAPPEAPGAIVSASEPASNASAVQPTAALDPVEREALIRQTAYMLYEANGCRPGHALEDWVAAEALVDSRLSLAVGPALGKSVAPKRPPRSVAAAPRQPAPSAPSATRTKPKGKPPAAKGA